MCVEPRTFVASLLSSLAGFAFGFWPRRPFPYCMYNISGKIFILYCKIEVGPSALLLLGLYGASPGIIAII